MIRLRAEGEPSRFGFNVFPPGASQIGFVFRLGPWRWHCRYSKPLGRWRVYLT